VIVGSGLLWKEVSMGGIYFLVVEVAKRRETLRPAYRLGAVTLHLCHHEAGRNRTYMFLEMCH
jgi:hypothetical protein